MSKKWILIPLIILIIGFCMQQARAQSAGDVLRYSLQYPSYDAATMVMPGVSSAEGFGTYQENPAAMALFDKGFFSFGLSDRSVNEKSSYLGNHSNFSNNQLNVGNMGFVYKVPAARGSFVIGAGYSQSSDFNRALSAGGRNNRSTITDFYNITADDSLFFAAFDAYALDFATTDSSYDETASIFRIGFANYPGIDQDVELTERGVMGEYSAFFATEFRKNLMLGASVGFISGKYSYKRNFLETDSRDDYNFQFIDSNGDGVGDTDVDHILSKDTITSTFNGFSLRLGAVYQISPYINIGASYQFKNVLSFDDDYNTVITTYLDNGAQPFEDEAPGSFSYKIVRPARIMGGLTLNSRQGIKASVSVEAVKYSTAGIRYKEIDLNDEERAINTTVSSTLEDVINVRASLAYNANPLFIPRIGYAYYPSPTKNHDSSRQFFSGGFSTHIFDSVTFNLGVQYSIWQDQNQLYNYGTGVEVAGEDVHRWNIMGGVKIAF